MEVFRTPEERFEGIEGYGFAARYHDWMHGGTTLRMHYLDEGEGPPILLLHGQPMWSWLYHRMIPDLVAAGYRCIAPDYIGFGKSDKVVGDGWYVIERHCMAIRSLIEALDLWGAAIVVHDWGGPIGLRQVADMPARFDRLFILNTWLHHIDMRYSPGIRGYHARMSEIAPETGDPLVGGQLADPDNPFSKAVRAPFPDVRAMGGIRRFPRLHPYAEPEGGNAIEQARCYDALLAWPKPAHVIFSHADAVFPTDWGRAWAERFPFGSFDMVETGPPHHFLQLSRGPEIAALMIGYLCAC